MIEGLGTAKKSKKLTFLLSEANLENEPSEYWPCLLVKTRFFQETDRFKGPKSPKIFAAGVNQPLPPVAASSGRLRAEKN